MRCHNLVLFTCTASLALTAIPASAQRATLRDSLLQAARWLDRGEIEKAKGIYKAVADDDDHSAAAKIGLGRVAMAELEWSDATSFLSDAIDLDTANVSAHYYAGIAYRELGTLRAWIIKNALWSTATDHFRHVMARDSSYQDVLLQYALLEQYRKNFDHAFALGRRQMELRPDLQSVRFGLFALYRYYASTNDPEEVLASLALQQSDWARYFSGVTLRREGRFDEAEEVFSGLIRTPGDIPPEAVTLAVARMLYSRGDIPHAEGVYWRSVDRITTWLGSALIFEELKYIVTDDELKTYNGLASDRKKSQFFHAFWNRRNPSAGSRTNFRLAEHYRRLDYSEKNLDFFGTRSHFNDPDKMHYLSFPKSFTINHELNDKGLIYLRMGEPDEEQKTSGGVSQGMTKEYEQHESWLYKGNGERKQQIFHFAKSNAVGNNWRLTSLPEDPKMLENLVMWDSRYNSLLDDRAPERTRVLEELRLNGQETVAEALATDAHSWSKETTIIGSPHAIETFRREGGKTLLGIALGIPLGDIAKESADDNGPLRVEVGLSVMRWTGEMIGSQMDTITFPAGSRGSAVELYRYVMKPDSVSVSMHTRPLGTKLFAGWKKELRVPDYTISEPTMSDVQFLLPSTSKSNYDFNGVKVMVSPFDAVPRSKSFMLYWELYNLTKDADGKTRVTTQVIMTPGDARPNEDSKVVYDETAEGREETEPQFVQLNIADLDKGLHTVTVRVTDRKRVYTFERSRLVELLGD